jgi:hypothetical protein
MDSLVSPFLNGISRRLNCATREEKSSDFSDQRENTVSEDSEVDSKRSKVDWNEQPGMLILKSNYKLYRFAVIEAFRTNRQHVW